MPCVQVLYPRLYPSKRMPALLPMLIPCMIENFDGMEQKIQFKYGDDIIRDILWDAEHERIVVLDNDNYSFIIDCEGTYVESGELTLKQALNVLGFNIKDYIITESRCVNPSDIFENIIDTPIKTQMGCQFRFVDS